MGILTEYRDDKLILDDAIVERLFEFVEEYAEVYLCFFTRDKRCEEELLHNSVRTRISKLFSSSGELWTINGDDLNVDKISQLLSQVFFSNEEFSIVGLGAESSIIRLGYDIKGNLCQS